MKKILVLGSASVHVKLIKAAQEMGIYTITTDNVPYEDSPGKKVSMMLMVSWKRQKKAKLMVL